MSDIRQQLQEILGTLIWGFAAEKRNTPDAYNEEATYKAISDQILAVISQTVNSYEKDFKAYFEANLLDGNDIHLESKGTMLNAQNVYEVISEYLSAKRLLGSDV